MADWYFEDRTGAFHKASFVPVKTSDLVQMRWTPKLLWSKEFVDKERMIYKLIEATGKIQGAISFFGF